MSRFGPQGWWPVTPEGAACAVYDAFCTAGTLTPAQRFEIAVGALLTQNTAWTNVEKALGSLREADALSPEALAMMPQERLQALIRSSGYFRQKAGRLAGFARHLLERWNGQLDGLLAQDTKAARAELLSIKGIGPETADSILLYAGNHPVFVVDAYTRRIGRRLGWLSTDDYGEVQKTLMSAMEPSLLVYREYHALLVALGKDVCRPAPRCGDCALRPHCPAGRAA